MHVINVTFRSPENSQQEVINRFHQLYYSIGLSGKGTWTQTHWMGVETLKYPQDLWMYQELLHRLRPDLIIETGTWNGGSALFLSHMMDLLGHGEVLSIDLEPHPNLPEH